MEKSHHLENPARRKRVKWSRSGLAAYPALLIGAGSSTGLLTASTNLIVNMGAGLAGNHSPNVGREAVGSISDASVNADARLFHGVE